MANPTGYSDIDSLISGQEKMIDESLNKSNQIADQQTALSIQQMEREKETYDKEATKANRGYYTEYRKASNPYGVNAENLASQGLANSGYAETTQANLYNTYQKAVSETLINKSQLKAQVDNQINDALVQRDITKAQNALELYMQKMNLLTQAYEYKTNRDQFEYQKSQDALTQANWEKEFAYQQERDRISDEQWQKQYELSKKASASSSSKRSSSSKKSSSSSSSSVNLSSNTATSQTQYTAQQVLSQAKMLQGANKDGTGLTSVRDGISGKTFSSVDALLKYYNV